MPKKGKKVHLKSILHELLWFIQGDTNIRYLVQNGVGIWNDWPFQNWLRETGQEEQFPKYPPEWKAKKKEFVIRVRDDADFAAEWEESNAALEAAAEEAAEEAAVLQLQSLFRRFRSREDRSRRQASGVIQRFWRCVSARRVRVYAVSLGRRPVRAHRSGCSRRRAA